MKCPICSTHMAVISVMTIFNAHCPSKKHRAWGEVTHKGREYYSNYNYIIQGIEIRKRIKNRNVLIQHFYLTKTYEIFLVVKKKIGLDDKKIAEVQMTEDEYKEKYESNPKALLKLLELAEVFK